MPLPVCPRCGKSSRARHICTGNLTPTQDARKSARRAERRAATPMVTIEVTEKTRRELNQLRAQLAAGTGKTRVIYDEVLEMLLAVYRNTREK